MKLLIAYDGSPCADAALDDLQLAGLPLQGNARVVTVTEIWLPPPPPSSYEIVEQARQVSVPADLKRVYVHESAAMKEAQLLAEGAATRLRSKFPEWEVSAESLCGSPAWELVSIADSWDPDLIVVGSHGRTALSRLFLGSVSQRVLTEARCSVRIARGRVEEPNTPVRILIGVDGSPASEAAVRAVASRRWPSRSEVRVVVVEDPLVPTIFGRLIPPVANAIKESNDADREWLSKVLQNNKDMLSGGDLMVSSEIREGDPKRELVAIAKGWNADCIFVGSIGFSNRLERFVLGSVSAAVAARAHCSVEVVRTRKTIGGDHHGFRSEFPSN